MKRYHILIFAMVAVLFAACCASCTENYSNGDRVGLITKFNQEGLIYNTWEGELNITQTGMNTGGDPFEFSIDKSNKAGVDTDALIEQLHEALIYGYLVKITYHKTAGKNLDSHRGMTDYFVTSCEIIEKNPLVRIPTN